MKSYLLFIICLINYGLIANTPDVSVPYKFTKEGELKLHIFFPNGHRISDSKPVILFFFAGGWVGGEPKQFFRQCKYLASRGIVAISGEYRIEKKHGTSPKECVMDAKSAVRWVRINAEKLGVDPSRFIVGGGSAGGHIAAATATLSGYNETGEDTSVSCIPNALVLFNPVFDNGPGCFGHNKVKDYWQEISPKHNISTAVPPTIIFQGTDDHLVDLSSPQDFRAQLIALGVRCELLIYEDQEHGFFNQAKYRETMLQTDRFLSSLGYLSGKPTL